MPVKVKINLIASFFISEYYDDDLTLTFYVAVTTTSHAPESFNHHVLSLCNDYAHMVKQDNFSWNESTHQELEDIIVRNPDYFEVECLDEDCYLDLQYIDVIKRIESYHLED